jgi:drug/metabolite transporter (DMT)-like permease
MAAFAGELAAIGAASCWVLTALAFAEAGRRVGATIVNVSRLWVALVILMVVHVAVFGSWIPTLSPSGWWYLGLSGVVGLTLGDQFLFRALVDAGPRISTLVMTISPALTAIIAWPVLDQPLGWFAVLGIVLTLGGIAWVVCERRVEAPGRSYPHPVRGVVFGLLGGVGQAVGLILAKLGMGEADLGTAVDPWSATLVRMLVGTIAATVMMAGLFGLGRIDRGTRSPDMKRGLPSTVPLLILLGAVFGPVIGVWLSLVSIERIDAGVAATLMSLSPVFILPVARFVEQEHIGMRSILGALLAVLGVAVLVFATDEPDTPLDQAELVSLDRSSPGATSCGSCPLMNMRAADPTSEIASSLTSMKPPSHRPSTGASFIS